MNKKNILILVSSILLVAIALFAYMFLNKQKPIEEVVQFEEILLVDDKGYSNINTLNLDKNLEKTKIVELSKVEIDDLSFMREEEKMAHDIYKVLFDNFGQIVFENIYKSEQTHTEAIKKLLDKYELGDIVRDNNVGSFENAELKKMYIELLEKGTKTIKTSFEVGAMVEEIDILDLQEKIKNTDKQDIIFVYENLMKGSRNHLRAFVKNYENLTGQKYVPQYLSQAEYDNILSMQVERGNNKNNK
ncbi:MAG: DUF2202 domain-containing protein [Candidatus Magasanikbacteria bacterium]